MLWVKKYFYSLFIQDMTDTRSQSTEEQIALSDKQNLQNKKIYFDADGTQVKIGYDEETGVGFVQLITE